MTLRVKDLIRRRFAITYAAYAPAVALRYGQFINTVIDFVIVAFSIFMVVKGINKLKKSPAK